MKCAKFLIRKWVDKSLYKRQNNNAADDDEDKLKDDNATTTTTGDWSSWHSRDVRRGPVVVRRKWRHSRCMPNSVLSTNTQTHIDRQTDRQADKRTDKRTHTGIYTHAPTQAHHRHYTTCTHVRIGVARGEPEVPRPPSEWEKNIKASLVNLTLNMCYKNDKKISNLLSPDSFFSSSKCTKIRFRPGLRPGPRWGAYDAPQTP